MRASGGSCGHGVSGVRVGARRAAANGSMSARARDRKGARAARPGGRTAPDRGPFRDPRIRRPPRPSGPGGRPRCSLGRGRGRRREPVGPEQLDQREHHQERTRAQQQGAADFGAPTFHLLEPGRPAALRLRRAGPHPHPLAHAAARPAARVAAVLRSPGVRLRHAGLCVSEVAGPTRTGATVPAPVRVPHPSFAGRRDDCHGIHKYRMPLGPAP